MQDLKKNKRKMNQSMLQHEAKEDLNEELQEIEEKINANLTIKEHIIDIKKLKVEENNSKIILETFVTVYKNIGTKEKIEEIEE